MDAKTLQKTLSKLGACSEAREWAKGKRLAQSWAECPRGDWMLWLAAKANVDRKVVVLAACACARLALPHVRQGEARPLQAIETAERWARDESGVTLEDVWKASRAAANAAAAAYAAAAAAAYAAYAAYAAADAAAAAYAANGANAANAAAYAADAAAHAKALAQCAALVREHISLEALTTALEAKS